LTASATAILKLDTKGHTELIKDIIVTKSGDIVSASDDKTIRVWSSTTGKEKRKILGQIGAGSEGKIYAIALSPDERFLAVGGMLANSKNREEASAIRIYNYPTGRLLKVLKSHSNVINDLAFSPDGAYLISASSDKSAKIWSGEDFRLLDTLSYHTKQVYGVKIIKKEGGYFAVTAGLDNQILLYSIQHKKVVKRDRKGYKLDSLATSDRHIAVCGDGREISIYDYDLNPIKTIRSKTKPSGLAYSANGEFLIAGFSFNYRKPTDVVNIYSVKEGYEKKQSFTKHTNLTMAVAFLDAQRAVSGGGNNSKIYIWDIERGAVLHKIEGVGESVWSVGIDGERIAWGNKSNYKNHHNRGELQKTLNLKTFQVGRVQNKKSFKKIAIETRHTLSLHHRAGGYYGKGDAILDIKQNGKVIKSIIRGATNGYEHRCYGFYGEYIISGGAGGQLKIYNQEGREVANLVGHKGEVWSIALDGDRLVSGGNDQTIRVWDLSQLKKTMQPQLNIFVTKTNEWIAWTKEGFYNASKGAEQYIGYYINQGANKEAKFLDLKRFRNQLYRPDLIAKALRGEDIGDYAKRIDIDAILKEGG